MPTCFAARKRGRKAEKAPAEAPFSGFGSWRASAMPDALIACARRDFVRDARFLWTIFLSAMRSITACDAWNCFCAAALSPAAIALRTLLDGGAQRRAQARVALVRLPRPAGRACGLGRCWPWVGFPSMSGGSAKKTKHNSSLPRPTQPRPGALRSHAVARQRPRSTPCPHPRPPRRSPEAPVAAAGATAVEPPSRAVDRQRHDAAVADHRARPRKPEGRGVRRRPADGRVRGGVPAAQHPAAAVRRGRVLAGVRSDLRRVPPAARRRRDARRSSAASARCSPSCCSSCRSLGVLAAPWLVYVLASGFAQTPGKVELTAEMIRIVFPYILFVSLVSLAGGVLNVYRRFAIPAFTPVLLNLSIIGAAIFLAPYCDPPIMALAWGVLIGGIAQLALQIRPLAKIGMLRAAALRLARRGRAPRAPGDGARGDRRVGGADLGAHQHAARGVARRRPHLVDHLRRPADGISERAARRRARHGAAAVAREASRRREPRRVLVAARLGPAPRVPARAAGGRRAVDARDAADRDALPVRQVHGQRRAADARRAAGLQRRAARPHPRQDPGAGLLRAAGHEDAGEDRVRDGARSRRRSR